MTGQLNSIQGRSYASVSTFTVVHLEILVYVNTLGTSETLPISPVVQVIVVYPIGIHTISLTLIGSYLTIIVDMIIEVNQDSVLL